MSEQKMPWRSTPLIESAFLSREAGCRVHLKLETLQPSGSFKSRGIGNYLLARVHERQSTANNSHASSSSHSIDAPIHFYSSSGGNAGLAAICAASSLRLPCTVVVPLSTPALMLEKIRDAGAADVIQTGTSWKEADTYLREELLRKDAGGVYVPPFDHEDIWAGNAGIVKELKEQWIAEGGSGRRPPAAVICSVGGGGLLCGIAQGLDEVGWGRVPIVAAETDGAHSLAASVRAGRLVELDAITSEATTLGAKQVARRAFEVGMQERTKSVVLKDREAAEGSWKLANSERLLVEMSCGVCVAVCLDQRLDKVLGKVLGAEEDVVVVVCGGSNVTVDMVRRWKSDHDESDRPRKD